jgi:hypothetical protein
MICRFLAESAIEARETLQETWLCVRRLIGIEIEGGAVLAFHPESLPEAAFSNA